MLRSGLLLTAVLGIFYSGQAQTKKLYFPVDPGTGASAVDGKWQIGLWNIRPGTGTRNLGFVAFNRGDYNFVFNTGRKKESKPGKFRVLPPQTGDNAGIYRLLLYPYQKGTKQVRVKRGRYKTVYVLVHITGKKMRMHFNEQVMPTGFKIGGHEHSEYGELTRLTPAVAPVSLLPVLPASIHGKWRYNSGTRDDVGSVEFKGTEFTVYDNSGAKLFGGIILLNEATSNNNTGEQAYKLTILHLTDGRYWLKHKTIQTSRGRLRLNGDTLIFIFGPQAGTGSHRQVMFLTKNR